MCQTTQSPMLPESRAVNVAVTQVFTDSFWPLDTGFGKKARLAGMKPTPPAVTQLQASRPAIRQPQFRAEARTHFRRPGGRRTESRNARLLHAGITMLLTKRTPSLRRRRKSPLFGPVSRCVGRMGAGWHPCQPKQVCCHCRRCVAEVGDDCWNTFPPELRVNLPVESIAG